MRCHAGALRAGAGPHVLRSCLAIFSMLQNSRHCVPTLSLPRSVKRLSRLGCWRSRILRGASAASSLALGRLDHALEEVVQAALAHAAGVGQLTSAGGIEHLALG
jgi:hypothetical protein